MEVFHYRYCCHQDHWKGEIPATPWVLWRGTKENFDKWIGKLSDKADDAVPAAIKFLTVRDENSFLTGDHFFT